MTLSATVHLPSSGTDNVKGFVNLVLDESFVITGLKIVEGKNGLFVSMPSRKVTTEGVTEYKDTAYPLTKELRDEINKIVLKEYDKLKNA